VERNEELYGEIVKLFAFVVHQIRLYSPNHPTAKGALEKLSAKLEEALGMEGELSIGVAEGAVIVNSCSLDTKKTGVNVLLTECKRLEIERLIMERGLGVDEMATLLSLMALPPKILQERGGFKEVFEQEALQHVRLGTAHYELVGDDDEVVTKLDEAIQVVEVATEGLSEVGMDTPVIEISDGVGNGGGSMERVLKIDRTETLVRYFLKGFEGIVDYDIERLTYEVETRPQDTASQMVSQPDSIDDLRRVVEGMSLFLQDRLAPPFIQGGRDFSLPVSRLVREVKKDVDETEIFQEASKEMVAILERCVDEIKLKFLVQSFVDSGGDLKSLAKFLRSRSTRERLEEPLKKKLLSMGVAEKDLNELFTATSEPRVPRALPRMDISPEELKELRRIRDSFNEEVAARVKEAVAVAEKEKQRALDEKERMNNIIRNVGEGLVVVDNSGKVQLLNPAAERLLGAQLGEGKGLPISQLLKGEHLLTMAKGPLRDDADPVTKEIELRSVNDETRKVLQASTAVIENQDGSTVGMVSVLSDITKQKQLEEMKSKFVSNVSHELRTPLLAIEESLSLLLTGVVGDVPPEQGKFLSIAQRNINRLSRLINDLLDVAKLEAGKMDMKPIDFDLNDLVHHVSETVRSLAEGQGVTIEEKFPGAAIKMEADPDRLTQVVTNLVGNAIKFTPEGGRITVEIIDQWQDPEISAEPCIAVNVRDTGPGISPEDQVRIFRKFEQGAAPTVKTVSSTGLGLTIAKEIVDLHGGKIWVESNQGEGSCFSFAVPRRFRNGADTAQVPI